MATPIPEFGHTGAPGTHAGVGPFQHEGGR
jgi:hypothetical protein